ncbi:MAG: glycosyltransferase family 4 protein [Solirubrobacterales bacterium]
MRIGICAYWFNRGQGVVARQIRTVLDDLGHETFVLARPTRESNIRSAFVDRSDVWDQPGITEASAYEIPVQEYLDWAAERRLDVAFFDQNYGFEGIAALRRSGVRTVGRFVWEQFSAADVGPASEALDVIYSLTRCEQERYAGFGIESPYVQWGVHPDLLAYDPGQRPPGEHVSFIYPAGFLSKRKPLRQVLRAFSAVGGEDLRLTVKAQVERQQRRLAEAAEADPRIEFSYEDLPTDEHLRRFAAADVCLAPSRWEGLGLHLYEAAAFGMPVITNDNPPMNEIVKDGVNGLLVKGRRKGEAKSGIPSVEPSVRGMRKAIERLRDPGLRAELRAGALAERERLAWRHTVDGYAGLVERVRGG